LKKKLKKLSLQIYGKVLELLILLVGGVYYLARSIFLGVYWDEVELHDRSSKVPMSNKTIFTSVGLSLLIAIFMGINSAVNYADSTSQGLWYFVQVLLVSIAIYLPIEIAIQNPSIVPRYFQSICFKN